MEKAKSIISWVMLIVGFVGFFVTFPLWLMNKIDDRMMLGITLVLSWAALWYSAFIAIQVTPNGEEES